MSVRYLLPCSCGQQVPVAASQAGGTVVCEACQATIEAPRLGELRELPVAEPEQAPPSDWNFRKGAVSTLLILAGLLAAGAGWFAASEPAPPEPFDIASRMEAVESTVESMTPLELWQSYVTYYEPMSRFGMYEANSPNDANTQRVIAAKRMYRNTLLIAAGVFVLLAAIAYPLLPK